MADILPFMYWKKYFEVFCYLKVFSNYHLSSILNKIKTTLYMLFYFQRKNSFRARAIITTYRRATSEMGQLWTGTTLGLDNFRLGQLWAGTTLIWANYVWDNFGLGQLWFGTTLVRATLVGATMGGTTLTCNRQGRPSNSCKIYFLKKDFLGSPPYAFLEKFI